MSVLEKQHREHLFERIDSLMTCGMVSSVEVYDSLLWSEDAKNYILRNWLDEELEIYLES